jgi:hypothetical protein
MPALAAKVAKPKFADKYFWRFWCTWDRIEAMAVISKACAKAEQSQASAETRVDGTQEDLGPSETIEYWDAIKGCEEEKDAEEFAALVDNPNPEFEEDPDEDGPELKEVYCFLCGAALSQDDIERNGENICESCVTKRGKPKIESSEIEEDDDEAEYGPETASLPKKLPEENPKDETEKWNEYGKSLSSAPVAEKTVLPAAVVIQEERVIRSAGFAALEALERGGNN